MIDVRFTCDRLGRQKGDVVSFDPVSAEAIVQEGSGAYVTQKSDTEPEPAEAP